MIFVSCENSSSLATRQPKVFRVASYPLTNTSTSIFFNCGKMTILLFKYHCALREETFDTIGNEPAVFPFRFIFIAVNNSRDITT